MSAATDDTRWQRIKAIFEEAIELTASERPAFLDEACGDDDGLRAEVEEMIAADTDAGDFMEAPAVAAGADGAAADDAGFGAGLVGKRIGQYLLQRAVSAGGMGVVFEALQEKPSRTVAVKLMRECLATRSALRRFEYESQILARLRHPGIAQVIEAGTHRTTDGTALPYFVMEYIPEARAITDYAREERLGTRDRLDLFMQVCAAVHHGHQKGVIHRDLKPGNILVDAQGQVKIIDFGIARATDSDIKLTTQHTDVGQLIGTVQYMSPEQCKADPDALDIRSDVYALGVVLYELLCEELPYDVRQAAIFEATRLIREEPPKRPSTVNRTLRGDVETIVLKALEKERERRYQSIAAFEDDIKRYLRGEVILARPAGPGRRLWKQIRRNPVVSASVGVAVAALIAFMLYLLLWSLPQLREERNKAEQERTAALEAKAEQELEAVNTSDINAFLEEMLSAADPYKVGYDVKVLEMLDRAAERIDNEFPDRPEIEASLRSTLATTYLNNGMYVQAEKQYRAALALFEKIHGPEHTQTLSGANNLAVALKKQGRHSEAEAMHREILAKRRAVLGEGHPETLRSMNNLANTLMMQGEHAEAVALLEDVRDRAGLVLGKDHRIALAAVDNLANVYVRQGEYAAAEILYRELTETRESLIGRDHPDTLISIGNLAGVLESLGRYKEAEEQFREVIRHYVPLYGDEHPETLGARFNLAIVLESRGKLEEAEALQRDVLEIRQQTLAADHPDILASQMCLADLHRKRGRLAQAEELHRQVLEARRQTLGDDHPDTLESMNGLAIVMKGRGRLEEAEELHRRVLETRRIDPGVEHRNTLASMNNLANVLMALERFEEAEALYREGLEITIRILGEDHRDTLETLSNLAVLLKRQEKYAEAEVMQRRVLEISRKVRGPDDPMTMGSLFNLANTIRYQGRHEEAAPMFAECLEVAGRALPANHSFPAMARIVYGKCLADLERYEEAEVVLLKGHELLNEIAGPENNRTRDAVKIIADLYETWGKSEKACEWRARLPAEEGGGSGQRDGN